MITNRPFSSKISLSLLLVLTTLIISCSINQYPSGVPDLSIEFGHGGGFAGIEHSFILLEDGHLFKAEKEPSLITKVPHQTALQLINQMTYISKTAQPIDSPGNTYKYMKYKNGENERRWVWNSSNPSTLDSQIEIIHTILMKFSNSNKASDNQ